MPPSHPGAVDWDTARSVAARVARRDPYQNLVSQRELEATFDAATAQAEELVADATGLISEAGQARARVADRAEWVSANLSSFQRLLRPVTAKFEERMAAGGRFAPITRKVAGAEVGALLGWMSSRVLGQYDLLVIEDEAPEEQDLVYYVGPNIVGLERRFAFPSREFRLWIALHECTHRAQFTGVPWLREHFLSLINELLEAVDPDPTHLVETARRLASERRSGSSSLDGGGLAALLATPAQREVLDRITGLMSLLEGHGEVTMDRAARGLVPSADRFGRVLRARRESARGVAKAVQRLIGLEAKLAQYAQGVAFIETVEAEGGRELFDVVWERPENLPSIAEVREPRRWLERVGGRPAPSGAAGGVEAAGPGEPTTRGS